MTSRQPKGVPTGGQFTVAARARTDVELIGTEAHAAIQEYLDPPEFVRDRHDEFSAFCLAVDRTINSNRRMASVRWRETGTEDLGRDEALGRLGCAPENADENARDGGYPDPSPETLAEHGYGCLGDNRFHDEMLDEIDRIKGAPPQRRAIKAACYELEMEMESRDRVLADSRSQTAFPGDATWYAEELAASELRQRFLMDDLDRLREKEGLEPLDRNLSIADQW